MSKTTTCWLVKSPDGSYWDYRSWDWAMDRNDATRFETKEEALGAVESLCPEPRKASLTPRVVRLVRKRVGVLSTLLRAESALSDVADGINKLDDARGLLVVAEERLAQLVEFLKEDS